MEHAVPQRRHYLARRVARFLPPETLIRQVFGAQCYTPWLVGPLSVLYILYTPLMRWRLVAVTDDGIFVVSASYWSGWRPKRVLRVLPRRTQLGPVGGPWARIQLGPERVWVNWRFFPDLRAADDEIPRAAPGGELTPLQLPTVMTPAEKLFRSELSWTQVQGKSHRFFVDHDGARWELHDDSSNQGSRFVLSANGRFAGETEELPTGWVLPGPEHPDPAPNG